MINSRQTLTYNTILLAMFRSQLQNHYSDNNEPVPNEPRTLLDWENWCECVYDRSSSTCTTLPKMQFGCVTSCISSLTWSHFHPSSLLVPMLIMPQRIITCARTLHLRTYWTLKRLISSPAWETFEEWTAAAEMKISSRQWKWCRLIPGDLLESVELSCIFTEQPLIHLDDDHVENIRILLRT